VDADVLFGGLLSIGRSAQFADAFELPGAGQHHAVLRIADTHLKSLIEYFDKLDQSDRPGFVKAVAAYENTVGGLGSVTVLHKLLPRLSERYEATLDWILANTRSYWWYAHGANSVAELGAIEEANRIRREQSLAREHRREIAAKEKKAARASGNLLNAIRRGDIKAVTALLDMGADPTIKAPDGPSLCDYALSIDRIDIANLLASVADT
jgi:hypothetical protein